MNWKPLNPQSLPKQNSWILITDGEEWKKVYVSYQFEFVDDPDAEKSYIQDNITHWCDVEMPRAKKSTTKDEKRKEVAHILLEARNRKGLTQEQLGELVGFKGNTIYRIESARFSPNADQLYALCEALDITLTLDGKEL